MNLFEKEKTGSEIFSDVVSVTVVNILLPALALVWVLDYFGKNMNLLTAVAFVYLVTSIRGEIRRLYP